MLYKSLGFAIVITLCCLLYAFKYNEYQRSELCFRYVDLVKPHDGNWNDTPMQFSNFRDWSDEFDKGDIGALGLKDINGYRILIPPANASQTFYVYDRDNVVQPESRLESPKSLYERLEQLVYATPNASSWWVLYSSVLELSNGLGSLDCKDISYEDWLKLKDIFEVIPIGFSSGFQGMEIVLDNKHKMIFIVSPYEGDRGYGYDGLLISLQGEKIIHFVVSDNDKKKVKASLIETATLWSK